MAKGADDLLDQEGPPIHTDHVNYMENVSTVSYTLPSPGLYSVVARVRDSVNNTAHARGLLLYDPDSFIETSNPFNVFGARRVGSNYWLSTLHDGIASRNDVKIAWEGRYSNAFYRDNDVLGPVKHVSQGIEDRSGKRATHAVHTTVGGIFRYDYNLSKLTPIGSATGREDPQWEEVPHLAESYRVSLPRSNGDAFAFHLKAQDLTGNEILDTINIRVDITPPVVERVEFSRNTGYGKLSYYSK